MGRWRDVTVSEIITKSQYCILTGERSRIVVVDVDVPGLDLWKGLNAELTYTSYGVSTPSGGVHAYFEWKEEYKNWKTRTDIFEKNSGIDLRTNGGCIVGEGSISDYCKGKKCIPPCTRTTCTYKGRDYIWNGVEEIVEMPTELEQLLNVEFGTYNEGGMSDRGTTIWHKLGLDVYGRDYDDWLKMVWVLSYIDAPPDEIHRYSSETGPDQYDGRVLDEKLREKVEPNFSIAPFLRRHNSGMYRDQWLRCLGQARTDTEYLVCCLTHVEFMESAHYCHIIYIYLGRDITIVDNMGGFYYDKLHRVYVNIPTKTNYFMGDLHSMLKGTKSLILFPKLSNDRIMEGAIKFFRQEDWTRQYFEMRPNDYELPLKNGLMIEFKTLTVRERTRDDHILFESNAEFLDRYHNICVFGNDCNCELERLDAPMEELFPFAYNHLLSFTCEEKDYVDALIVQAGYYMSGYVSERGLDIFFGNGMNGKSLFFKILEEIMGPYFTSIKDKVLFDQGVSQSTTDTELISVRHARLGFVGDTRPNTAFNHKNVKMLTGGDTLRVRGLYKEEEKLVHACKFVVACNEQPVVGKSEQAMYDRIKLYPCDAKFENSPANRDYVDSIWKEHIEEFATLFLCGAHRYYWGRSIPKISQSISALESYIEENRDPIDVFIRDKLEKTSNTVGDRIAAQDLYRSWTEYVVKYHGNRGHCSQREFTRRVKGAGFETVRSAGTKWVGIRLQHSRILPTTKEEKGEQNLSRT